MLNPELAFHQLSSLEVISPGNLSSPKEREGGGWGGRGGGLSLPFWILFYREAVVQRLGRNYGVKVQTDTQRRLEELPKSSRI